MLTKGIVYYPFSLRYVFSDNLRCSSVNMWSAISKDFIASSAGAKSIAIPSFEFASCIPCMAAMAQFL